MYLKFQQTVSNQKVSSNAAPIFPHHKKPKSPLLWLVLLLGVSGMLFFMSQREFIEYDEAGNPKLAKWREEKLKRELEELDNAEQYVLVASISGWYPCYNCAEEGKIFLEKNEVWKYGVTAKGEARRYAKGLPSEQLNYFVEFSGTLQACLKQEKIKIYHYPLLLENLKRKNRISRPPGNKIDR